MVPQINDNKVPPTAAIYMLQQLLQLVALDVNVDEWATAASYVYRRRDFTATTIILL